MFFRSTFRFCCSSFFIRLHFLNSQCECTLWVNIESTQTYTWLAKAHIDLFKGGAWSKKHYTVNQKFKVRKEGLAFFFKKGGVCAFG